MKVGIWSKVSKQYVFGISADNANEARKQLRKIIGNDALKYRFVCRDIKEKPLPPKLGEK